MSADRGPKAKNSPKYKWIGQPLPRLEDERLLRGAGTFTDNVNIDGQAWCVFVRSPHAHADIRGIDAASARNMTGVLGVLTGDDYIAAGYVGLPQGFVSVDAVEWKKPAFSRDEGHVIVDRPHMPLAINRARYTGEIVALVVARTQDEARAAAEMVVVDCAPRACVTDAVDAIKPGAPLVWDDAPNNVAFEATIRPRSLTDADFARAHLIVEGEFRSPRILPAQLEPRSALGDYDATTGKLSLVSGCQGVHRVRGAICAALKLPPERVRVSTPDVGGGFGGRSSVNPEQVLIAWAALALKHPVKWTSDRAEACLSDFQTRDALTRGRLALGRDGKILAYDFEMVCNLGAHGISLTNLHNAWRVATSVYDIPRASTHLVGALTNTMVTSVYRGAGRPEAILTIERLIDMAARKLGVDRVELRRRNMITRRQLPYHTASGLTWDSGDFIGNMEETLTLVDWAGFPERRLAAHVRGKLAGVSIVNSIETPIGMPHERAELLVKAQGKVEMRVGTQSSGQGHETVYAQVAADMIGVTPADIVFIGGDTDEVASGGGSHSDRSMRLAGALLVEAGEAVVAQGKRVAAALLGVGAESVAFADGVFATPGNNRTFDLFDLAREIESNAALPSDLRVPLGAKKTFDGRIPAHPTGAVACEVEIDPDTGHVDVLRYATVYDAGQPINPLILEGQKHGAIAQGVGPALVETVAWDAQGQVLTGSFMDYAMPRADMLPMFDVGLAEDPTATNVLRVKGGGEGGTTPAPAAVMNAVHDALASAGVTHIDMPATPARVWKAIRDART